MKLLITLALIFVSTFAIKKQSHLEQKLYSGELELTEQIGRQVFRLYKTENQMEKLFPVFYDNLQTIVNHNTNSTKSWKMGINEFAFITREEFHKNFLGASPQNCSATAYHTLKKDKLFNNKRNYNYPESVNWTATNNVSPVKDQRHCGSCWTFATTGALESHWSILFDQFPPYFSEQQLVDCAQDFDNHGCDGGLPSQAFEYIKYNGGLQFESSYPYAGVDGDGCFYQPQQKGAYVNGGSYNITFQDEEELTEKVGNVGPVAVAFQVQGDFHLYESGIYDDPACSTAPEDVNHAVLATGYGTSEDGIEFWYIKNSWSRQWGEEGYFQMVRGKNMCGVADCASYPLIE